MKRLHSYSIIFKAICLMALLLAVLAPGCNESDTTQPAGTTGKMQVRMTDSPGTYDHVFIVVDSVRAHIETNDTTAGWVTLNRNHATYDLIALTNGADTVIGEAELPVGRYTQIRLYIGSGSTLVVDGVTHPLTTPSGSQSGVKLNVNAVIQPDIVYILILDFDANRSIVKTGSPTNPNYILKPVIRTSAAGTTGIIAGVVIADTAGATVWGFSATDTASTMTSDSGNFKLVYLPSGTYTVQIVPGDTLFYDSTITGINVLTNQTVNMDTIRLRQK